VTETAPERSLRIVGREAELTALDEVLHADGAPGALVLTGGPGIGKTTLWEAGVELARRGGLRVLSARGSDSETQLSFAAIIDLLDGVDREELGALPSPQLHALEAALLRAEPSGDPPPPAAISVGFLSALRALAAQQPLLLAVDDVQWLDAASAEAVAFAVRRLEGHPVRFLFAKRSRASSMLERAYGPKGLRRLEVVPLSLGATQRLLRQRLALSLSRHVLRRIVEATLGNPLFALELGRALAARGPLGIGEDVPLPDTVEELLGTRVGALAAPSRRLVLAVALSGELRTSQLAEIGPPAALDDALDSGVLVVDGDRVRPAHPLFATAARTSAGAGVRRELHLALAQLATDDESKALHLALATDRPDAELAATVAAAAADAASRGARHKAVLLAEHALRLTHDPAAERSDRVLTLGGYLVAAGEKQRLTELLTPEVETLPRGAPRVQALLLLTEGVVGTNDEIRSYLLEALRESGSDAVLRASVLVELVVNDVVIRIEGIPAAEASALEALEVARGAGPDLERPALQAVGWARALRGRAIDDLVDRFRAASSAPAYMAESPERVAGQRLVWRGEIEQARALLTPLLALADERGESYSYVLQRLHMCQLELRVGNWEAVGGLLDEWGESSERVMWPMYERCRALLAAGRGLPEEAEHWAAETLARAEATGTRWDRLEALRARGVAALLANEPARAAECLRAVWEHTRSEEVDEPGVFPVAPELVEALIELGELDEAKAVTARLRELADAQDHPWGLATAKRVDALVQLAGGYDEAALAALEQAAAEYGLLGLRFDRARTVLTLGRAQRRAKKWGAARASLEQAVAELDELGSPGWADQARSELERVGGRRRQPAGELTSAEQRVVELAAEGLANKEIAQTLFVSVRTVEVHLKHAYAKLGIRSRTQLARRHSERA
jgi:DNA-binding CsgD family transcriptional regulator